MTNCMAYSRACYGLITLGLLFGHVGSASSAADLQIHLQGSIQSKVQSQPEGTQILQFSGEYASAKLAIFPATSSMQAGQLFKTARKAASHAPTWIPTGKIKIVEVRDQLAFALVVETGTGLSRSMFQKFPGPMAGDKLMEYNPTIAKNIEIVPDVEESYFDVFRDPKANPTSFELTEEGVSRLMDKLKPFQSSRVSMVLVEGYTDMAGLSAENQAESYQRALAVRSLMIKELEMSPDRVVAIGYGDGEQKPIHVAQESRRGNRRIVIRAVNIPPELK